MKKPAVTLKKMLVVATASEARRNLITDLGIDPILESVDIDESAIAGEGLHDYVRRLAISKASAVLPPSADSIIVSVDTAIGIEDAIVGKPSDETHAIKILKELSGKTHEVLSSIALRDVECNTIDVETTRTKVRFNILSDAMISWYISTGEWKNRAGAYAIQGKGMSLVESLDGCLTNVIGISIPSFIRMISKYTL
jgi:septum formation protein